MGNEKLETLVKNLHTKFYGIWYEDLHHLDDVQLMDHWANYGKMEGRSPNPTELSQRMHWPVSGDEWEGGLESLSSERDIARKQLIEFIQLRLIGGTKRERNPKLKDVLFDRSFYKNWYPDLSSLSDEQLEKHWQENGKSEGRFGCFRAMLAAENLEADDVPAGFDDDGYIGLNKQVGKLKERNFYSLAYHYLINGRVLGYSYYFDPFFYRSFYDDLNPTWSASDLLGHYIKYGTNEKRFPNLEAYLEAKSGVRLLAHFNAKLNAENILVWNPHLQEGDLTHILSQLIKAAGTQRTRIFFEDAQNALFYADFGAILMQNGEHDNALKAFYTSLSFSCEVTPYELLGLIYGQQKRTELTQEVSREAIRLGSKRIDVLDCYLSSNDANIDFSKINEVISYVPNYKGLEKIRLICERLWNKTNAKNKVLATRNDRESIKSNTTNYALEVRKEFSHFFRRFSTNNEVKVQLSLKRVLIVGDEFIAQCVRYRIEQKAAQLNKAGFLVERIGWDKKLSEIERCILLSDIIIFYRCPAIPSVLEVMEKAKALGKLCIYEMDDLIFSSAYPPPIETYGAYVDADQYTELCRSFWLYGEAAKACHFAIGSTRTIVDLLDDLVLYKKGFIHRNALDQYSFIRAKKHTNEKKSVDLFYGSATFAHNSDFTSELLPVVIGLMNKYDNIRLIIVGHLELGNLLPNNLRNRVKLLPYISDTGTYLELLSQSDINLAILEKSNITDAKSEIKWMEAGALGIPSVVSATSNYCDVIEEGETGFIADSKEQWSSKLSALIESAELRNSVGLNALNYIVSNYSEEAMSRNINEIIRECVSEFYKADA